MVCIEIPLSLTSSKDTRNRPLAGNRRALAAEVERCRSNGVATFAVHVPAQLEALFLAGQGPEVADERLTWHEDPDVAKPGLSQHDVITEGFQRWWERTALVRFKREGIRTGESCENVGWIKRRRARLGWCSGQTSRCCRRAAAPGQCDHCDEQDDGVQAAPHLCPLVPTVPSAYHRASGARTEPERRSYVDNDGVPTNLTAARGLPLGRMVPASSAPVALGLRASAQNAYREVEGE